MTKRDVSYEEMARQEDEKVAKGREGEGLVRVRGKAANADHIYSLRFTPDEIALIRNRAAANGIKVSQFVRNAVMNAAQRPGEERPAVVREIHAKVQELADAVERL
jgi:uncharacterized protein (DUF1778 family)